MMNYRLLGETNYRLHVAIRRVLADDSEQSVENKVKMALNLFKIDGDDPELIPYAEAHFRYIFDMSDPVTPHEETCQVIDYTVDCLMKEWWSQSKFELLKAGVLKTKKNAAQLLLNRVQRRIRKNDFCDEVELTNYCSMQYVLEEFICVR